MKPSDSSFNFLCCAWHERSRRWPILVGAGLALALLCPIKARAELACSIRSVAPIGAWPSRAGNTERTRPSELKAFEDYAFTLQGSDAERLGARTDGVVIIQDGEIVYERYARGWRQAQPHLAWSVSKSVVNALTGIAVGQGLLSLEDSICIHVDPVRDELCQITVKDLLAFGSGLDWKEVYEDESNQMSSVLAMLYGEGHRDLVRFITSHPLRDPPGSSYAYSSGDTNLLSAVIGRPLSASYGEEYPFALLFEPLGMQSVVFERDARGVYIGSSYLYATPRDLARFGLFALDDGCWNGKRLLPEGWMAKSTTVSDPFRLDPRENEAKDVEGWQWWLNQPVPEQGIPLPYPKLPEDSFFAEGHWGQTISVIPSLDMVVVRVADDRDGSFDLEKFLELAIALGRAP